MAGDVFVGVAGWAIPRVLAGRFAPEGSALQRSASRFNAAEINSSFYKPHRRSTYERWAASVPDGFRFAVKLPKAITHEARLVECGSLLEQFAEEVAGLGGKRGPVLMQLPPKLAFDPATAQVFLREARSILGGAIACEPRHPSWFEPEADTALAVAQVARVVADPAVTPLGAQPGGWRDLAYIRLHGAPRIYWSEYPAARIGEQAALVRALAAAGRVVWTIFDNTAAGQAPANALALLEALGR